MTTLAFIADLHIGDHKRFTRPDQGVVAPLPSRVVDITRVLRAAVRRCEEEGVDDLFILGDVFDTTTPTPQMIAEFQSAIFSTRLQIHILVGNHDQVSSRVGDHALVSVRIPNGRVRVYDKPCLRYVGPEWRLSIVPYIPGNATDYLPNILAELAAPPTTGSDLLLLHLGLRDPETPPWLANSHDSIHPNIVPAEYLYTFAGNWHSRKIINRKFVQVGALVPTGFDNPGPMGYGSIVILRPNKKLDIIELPGPRFLRATSLRELELAIKSAQILRSSPGGDSYETYISARLDAADRDEAVELVDLSGHKYTEITVNGVAAAKAAKAASDAATAVGALDPRAAVSAYVSKMSLPDEVDRDNVLRKTLEILPL